MNNKKIFSLIAAGAASLFTLQLSAQDTPMSRTEYNRMDSVQGVYKRDQVQTQKAEDLQNMTDAKNERSETKAKAKEAQRIEGEANDAAKQSKNALKSEKKAQKQRNKADKQADKAKASREKSDLN